VAAYPKNKAPHVTGEDSSAAEERSYCAILDDVAQITSARIWCNASKPRQWQQIIFRNLPF